MPRGIWKSRTKDTILCEPLTSSKPHSSGRVPTIVQAHRCLQHSRVWLFLYAPSCTRYCPYEFLLCYVPGPLPAGTTSSALSHPPRLLECKAGRDVLRPQGGLKIMQSWATAQPRGDTTRASKKMTFEWQDTQRHVLYAKEFKDWL